jgi:histidine triad (HIT) family protein
MKDCLFCQIVRGERSAYTLFEDEKALAFLDIFPCATGHTLVIPRRHYSSLEEMPREEVGALFQAAVLVAEKVQKAVGAQGFNLGVNNGRAAGQEVFHIHVHIIPRYVNDGGRSMKAIVRAQVGESLETIAKKIRQVISPS